MDIVKEIKGKAIQDAIDLIINAIAAKHCDTDNLFIVGIADGGLELSKIIASRLSDKLGREILTGTVNIAFQRDDIGQNPIPKIYEPTHFPFDVEETTIILVDDVLYAGRSTRAALNEIFDQGRPDCIELAVLCDRGYRRLPINANYVGLAEDTTADQEVKANISHDNPENNSIQILTK